MCACMWVNLWLDLGSKRLMVNDLVIKAQNYKLEDWKTGRLPNVIHCKNMVLEACGIAACSGCSSVKNMALCSVNKLLLSGVKHACFV